MLSPLYLILNDESYLALQALEKIRQQAKAAHPNFEESVFNAAEKSSEDLITDLGLRSFFTPFRLIRVENPEKIKKTEWTKIIQTQEKNELCSLIVTTSKKDLFRELGKLGAGFSESFSCVPLKNRELIERVVVFAKEEGKKISSSCARLVVELVGDSLEALHNQMTLLSLSLGEKTEITEEAILVLLTQSSEKSIFDLSRALDRRKGEEVFSLLQQKIANGEVPLQLLGFLTRHFRLVLKAKVLQRRGISGGQAASVLKVPPFAVDQYFDAARAMSWKTLLSVYRNLLKTDRALKSSSLAPAFFLRRLLWEALELGQHSKA